MKDHEEVIDLAGNRAEYRVSVDSESRRKRYIVRSGSSRNIEVIVFRELLQARGYKFGA